MSTAPVQVSAAVIPGQHNADRAHHLRVVAGYLITFALVAFLFVYGWDYYLFPPNDRPFSPKHHLLRPSGRAGVNLGIAGFVMFLIIFLYPLRKCWPWLGRQGVTCQWLDYHVLLGIAATFVIALHASFKCRDFAVIAFSIMLAVSISGIIGRYLYGHIKIPSRKVYKQ